MNMEDYPPDPCFDCSDDCSICNYYDNVDTDYDDDIYDEDISQDSGFLGSMLEAQLIRNSKEICLDCGKKISSVLSDPPNTCKNKKHADFKALFEVRCKIGLNDLRVRGYD